MKLSGLSESLWNAWRSKW